MNVRRIAVCLAATAALGVAGCGDDDESKGASGSSTTATTATTEAKASAEGGTIKDVEPRTAKPNVAGGNAPIEEFSTNAANDAGNYWEQVFENSQLPYARPTVDVATSTVETGCGQQFDPAKLPFYLCADAAGPSTVTLGAPLLEQARSEVGDAGVAFLAGYGMALDANDQLSGKPIGNGETVDEAFQQVAACFTGAWIRNLNDRELLEAGDDEEVLALAAQFVPGGGDDPAFGRKVVASGFNNGGETCQSEYGGPAGE